MLLLVLGVSGCGRIAATRAQAAEMKRIGNAIHARYPEEKFNVSMSIIHDEKEIAVKYVNSPARTEAEQQARAANTATVIVKATSMRLDTVDVYFVRQPPPKPGDAGDVYHVRIKR